MVILGIVLVLAGAGLMVAEAHLPTAGVLGLLALRAVTRFHRLCAVRLLGAFSHAGPGSLKLVHGP